MKPPAAQPHVPVLIAGGGLAGLSAAMFLARLGVRTVLAERYPTTSIHPRARGQNPVVMEALRAPASVTRSWRRARPGPTPCTS
jgi:putative polyketide hydroxylase